MKFPGSSPKWLQCIRPGASALCRLILCLGLMSLLPGCSAPPEAFPEATNSLILPTVSTRTTDKAPTRAAVTLPPAQSTPMPTPEAGQAALLTPNPTPYPSTPPGCTKIGQTWTSPVDGMLLKCVPDGSFNYEGDGKGSITLPAFWMDVYEVTNAQYAACVTQKHCTPPGHTGTVKDENGSYYDNPRNAAFPVTYVSYLDAVNYCNWAGRRLPTEVEWQKAARGPTSRANFTWGKSNPTNNLANMGTGGGLPVAVGSYPAGKSPYGMLDMIGNVREWTSTTVSGKANTVYYVKGGSFDSLESELDIGSMLTFYDDTDQSGRVGFRCVYSPGQ